MYLLQDDAIRNLFSANTIHEFSAQSLLTFLVLHSIHLLILILRVVQVINFVLLALIFTSKLCSRIDGICFLAAILF